MSIELNLDNYKNEEGFYDFDAMFYDIETIRRQSEVVTGGRNPIFSRNYGNGDGIVCTIIQRYKDTKEYKEYEELEQKLKEDRLVVFMRFMRRVEELQARCNHYPAIYRGEKICLKCKKEL